jgi:two-component system chemotaxis sensor kinase CheA
MITVDEFSGKHEEDSAEEVLAKLRETFRDEACELLAEVETALLNLEISPHDQENVGRIFRALHTIKGSGSICDFKDVSSFTHEVESFLDMARKGKLAISKEFIELTLTGCDQIRAMLNAHYGGRPSDGSACREIVSSFHNLISDTGPPHENPPCPEQTEPPFSPLSPPPKIPAGKATYRIRFRTGHDLFTDGMVIANILERLSLLGHCQVTDESPANPGVAEKNPADRAGCWDIILITDKGKSAIEEVFLSVKDAGELAIEVINGEQSSDKDISYKKIGEILVDRGDLAPEDVERVLSDRKKFGEILVETGLTSPAKVQSALVEQHLVREMRKERQKAEESACIRVATDKLDSLVDLVGELVTVQANLNRIAVNHGIPEFLFIAEQLERLTSDLYDKTMGIRMVPIKTIFGKLRRLVHDLSLEMGKEIEFVTEGGETELDKTVIDRLSDPLVHLIRNCIDHGIECPETREIFGKPRCGTVCLSAEHSGAHVLIRIRDDGAGLDREAIRAKGVERGLIHPDAAPSDKELFSLVFLPGFSTAKSVTDVSGRGVGMDVVNKAVDSLRGSMEIDSARGSGTQVTLSLPLTLAIINGLLVETAGESFVLPLTFVREIIELTGEERSRAHGRHITNVRGEFIPYINLRECFLLGGALPSIEQIVITEMNGNRVGLVVDKVIGDHQTVIKNLGACYVDAEGISGATILGSGAVALILDVPGLVRIAEREEARMRTGG